MPAVVHHALLGLSIAFLVGAAIRTASLAAPAGPDRLVAAVVLAAAAAVAQALVFGLAGLGASPIALSLAAAGTWLVARRFLPRPSPSVSDELTHWWLGLGSGARAGVGAMLGTAAAWAAWTLSYPVVGENAVVYHLPEIVGWLHNGRPGSIQLVMHEFPVGNYPLTHEVLTAWAMGISRSFVPAALAPLASVGLLLFSGWAGLRSLQVSTGPASLALAAVCGVPIIVIAMSAAAGTEIPAVAWLVCAAALCASSARRPGLLAPAVVAVGLGVGTKTTVAPLAAVVLSVALVHRRDALRSVSVALGLAVAAAAVVGGTWYVRNLVTHGSPFWPFVAAPWGDPRPALLEAASASFLDHPRATVSGREDHYLRGLAGGLILLVGAFLAALLDRGRAVLGAAVATGLASLAWANAPFTGIDDPDFSLATDRYLLPAIVAATGTVALAARTGARARKLAIGVLVVAIAWNVYQALDLGEPFLPPVTWLVVGVVIGALVAVAQSLLGRGLDLSGVRAGLAAAIVGAALVFGATGYVERHGRTVEVFDSSLVRWFSSQPEFVEGRRPVALAPAVTGLLAGDRLRHPVNLIRHDETCRDVQARAGAGWVVVPTAPDPLPGFIKRYAPDTVRALDATRCLRVERPVFDDGTARVYRLGQPPLGVTR